eukprot:s6826_g3.t1
MDPAASGEAEQEAAGAAAEEELLRGLQEDNPGGAVEAEDEDSSSPAQTEVSADADADADGTAASLHTEDASISSFSPDSDASNVDSGSSSASSSTSSERGSSSSSSHGDGGVAAEDSPVAVRRAPVLHRREGVPELRFDLGELGDLRYNTVMKYYRAKCGRHQCERQRTAAASDYASRAGQGRPLGLLAAWLRDHDCSCKREHVAKGNASLAERRAARDFLKTLHTQEAYDEFASFERPRRENEAEEPDMVP